MANRTPITELDFFAAKEQFKTYLRNQTRFKDYDFEGSNLNVILDVLSYNTFINNFYTNMTFSEMFLDSAQMRNSVVSHAKELNYLPRSATSARASVRLRFQSANPAATILIPRDTIFTTSYQGENFSFVTEQTYVARRITSNQTGTNTFVATDFNSSGDEIGMSIFEGVTIPDIQREAFILDDEQELRCVLSNENVDINSIRVFVGDLSSDVLDEETEDFVEFRYRKDIFGVQPNDPVFYVEPHFDEKYSVVFGKNVFGRQPGPDEEVGITYRVCSEDRPNGANRFTTNIFPNVIVETLSPAKGGAPRESVSSIKFFAPKSIQIQERAVTETDYEILLKQRFPQIKSVSVYGGDELDPPRYGKVAISINLQGNVLISESSKNEFERYLSDKSPLAIQPIFVNPDFIYVDMDLDVFFTRTLTTKSLQNLEQEIRNVIKTYNDENLNDFGSSLRVSRLSSLIDNVDPSVISNRIIAKPFIEYSPPLLTEQNPVFNFNSALVKPYPFRSSIGFQDYKPAIQSSVFGYRGVCAFFVDDGQGNIQILSDDIQNIQVLAPSIGTVDYNNGIVRLSSFAVNSFAGPAIKVFANTVDNDISSPKSRILLIRDENVKIKLVEKK
jgi:hypothetical protein